jgi:phospholipid/cholesterol/gamma-HCH transport system permease protein
MFANFIAVMGAYLVSNYFLNISFSVFFISVRRFFSLKDLVSGLLKSVTFAGVTSLLGCHIGFRTHGGAEGVGLATIRSFVISAALILILDYVLWMLLF